MNKYELYAHNNYIELLVNYGLIGTIIYYIVFVMILVKSCIIWLNKIPEVIISIALIAVILITDYGLVSYYSTSNLIYLAVSFRICAVYDFDRLS